MHINAPQTKLVPALIPGGEHQAVLLEGESLEEVDRFKYLGPMFIANDQATKVIWTKILIASSALSNLQHCPWSRR